MRTGIGFLSRRTAVQASTTAAAASTMLETTMAAGQR